MTFANKTASPWLLSEPSHRDVLRIFCLPYAGGGASMYRGWEQSLPAGTGWYPIQLPGRENRMAEPSRTDMSALVEDIATAIAPYLQPPFILLGHSLGARVAFELARQLRRSSKPQPCRLVVSGSRAPHIPEPRPLHKLPDEAFVQELRRFSGTPEAILQNKELMDLFLPILRADFTLDETYVYSEENELGCAISAFAGTSDPEANREEMKAWSGCTNGAFTLEMIEGGHFFVKTNTAPLLNSLASIVREHMERRA
ncbi:thioesterase [Paenibacillus sp. HN-1]|nr:alpha/beta fold hydrolase [Paenibacillus sinensis]MBY9080405.1 thioesterase [Paenibacillus sp. CGMCC 1.18879]MBY9083985.1 thioesterase [Paenibacillus sinensis]